MEFWNSSRTDVIWIGTAAHEQIFGKHAVARLLDDDLRTDATPYDVELTDVKEIALGPAVATLFVQTRASLRGRTGFRPGMPQHLYLLRQGRRLQDLFVALLHSDGPAE